MPAYRSSPSTWTAVAANREVCEGAQEENMLVIPRMGGRNTHVTRVVVHLRKKIHDSRKALHDMAPDGHMVAPGVALLLLGVGEVRGDGVGPPVAASSLLSAGDVRGGSGSNDRLVVVTTELLIHLRAEDLLGGRNELEDLVGGVGRSSGVDVPRVHVLLAALR